MPEQEQKILRIQIDGIWTAAEFSGLLGNMGDVYGVFCLLEFERRSVEELRERYPELGPQAFLPFREIYSEARPGRFRSRRWQVPLLNPRDPTEGFRFIHPNEQLLVKRIRFESPGSVDLAGLGTAIDALVRLTSMILDLFTRRTERRQGDELRHEQIREARLKNLRDQVAIMKELGFSQAEIRQMVSFLDERSKRLDSLVSQSKIQEIKELTPEASTLDELEE